MPYTPLIWLIFMGHAWCCEVHIESATTTHNVPAKILKAIGLTESGRMINQHKQAWPWTINVNGKAFIFASKQEAIKAVNVWHKKNVHNIDIGCMQINLKHHPHAFKNLEEAFDPKANIAYAAQFLSKLFQKWQSWTQAIVHYHSAHAHGQAYLQRVLKNWQDDLERPHHKSKNLPTTRVITRIIHLQ